MTVGAVGTKKNPWPGPRAYDYKERIYGRTKDSEQFIRLLVAERIVLLFSPSGAGKTSIFQAEIRPLLEEDGFLVLPTIRIGLELPADRQAIVPNRYLASAILSLEEGLEEEGKSLQITESLGSTLAAACEASDQKECVVFFDQFEELVTKDRGDTAAKFEFMQELGEALRNRSVWAVFAMREDYIGNLDPYVHLIPTRFASAFRLDFLTRSGAREAITEPAAAAHRPFADGDHGDGDEGPVTDLLNDLEAGRTARTGYIEPLHLSVAAHQLWSRLDAGDTITTADVERLGSVDDALENYFNDAIATIVAEHDVSQRDLRDWFESELIAGSFRKQTLNGPDGPASIDDPLIEEILDTHLVRTFSRGHALWLELAHDRLVEPLKACNRRWRSEHLTFLQSSAAAWEESGRQGELLLTGIPLNQALEEAESPDVELSEGEKEYLDRSSERNTKRRRRTIYVAVAVGLVLVFLVTAVVQRLQADAARNETADALLLAVANEVLAEQRAAEAETARQEAEESAADAAEAQQRAEAAQARAEAQRLAAVAGRSIGTDINLSLMLGLEAQELGGQESLPANAILYEALQGTRAQTVFRESDSQWLAFTPDGVVLSLEESGEVLAWDPLTGTSETVSEVSETLVITKFALTPDGEVMAVEGESGAVIVVSNDLTWELAPTELGFEPIADMVLSIDGATVLLLMENGAVLEWELAANTVREVVTAGGGARSVAISPDGSTAVIGTATGEALFVDLDDPDAFGPVDEGAEGGTSLGAAYHPDGDLAAMGAADGTVRIWDPVDGTEITRLVLHTDSVTEVAFTTTPEVLGLVSAGRDGTAVLWDLITEETLAVIRPHTGGIVALAVAPAGDTIALATESGWTGIWSIGPGHSQPIRDLAYDPLGDFVITGGQDGTVRLWTTRGELFDIYDDHDGIVWDVDFSLDGVLTASVGSDGVAVVRDFATGELVRRFTGHTGIAFGVAFSPDSSRLATSDEGGVVRIFSMSSQTPRMVIDAHEKAANALAFSPDGTVLASASDDTTIALWDVESGELIRRIEDPEDSVASVAFSPDGTMLAAGGFDRQARIFAVATGEQIDAATDFQAPVYEVAFGSDGAILAVVTAEASVGARLFPINGGVIGTVKTRIPHLALPYALAFSPDGTMLATAGGGEQRPFFHPLDPNDLAVAAARLLTRHPSLFECTRYGIDPCEAKHPAQLNP